MEERTFQKVTSWRERRRSLTFPFKGYQKDPLWAPPLIPEKMKVINPAQGAFFGAGEAKFFIVWQGGQRVETVCAARRGLDTLLGPFHLDDEDSDRVQTG